MDAFEQLVSEILWMEGYLDMVDDDWLEKLTPERRAELEEVRDGDVARGFAQQILAAKPH